MELSPGGSQMALVLGLAPVLVDALAVLGVGLQLQPGASFAAGTPGTAAAEVVAVLAAAVVAGQLLVERLVAEEAPESQRGPSFGTLARGSRGLGIFCNSGTGLTHDSSNTRTRSSSRR